MMRHGVSFPYLVFHSVAFGDCADLYEISGLYAKGKWIARSHLYNGYTRFISY